jgi:hypothetical protein
MKPSHLGALQVFVISNSFFLEVGTALAAFTIGSLNFFVLFDDVSLFKFVVMKVIMW